MAVIRCGKNRVKLDVSKDKNNLETWKDYKGT